MPKRVMANEGAKKASTAQSGMGMTKKCTGLFPIHFRKELKKEALVEMRLRCSL